MKKITIQALSREEAFAIHKGPGLAEWPMLTEDGADAIVAKDYEWDEILDLYANGGHIYREITTEEYPIGKMVTGSDPKCAYYVTADGRVLSMNKFAECTDCTENRNITVNGFDTEGVASFIYNRMNASFDLETCLGRKGYNPREDILGEIKRALDALGLAAYASPQQTAKRKGLYENKQDILDALTTALQLTDNLHDLVSLKYVEKDQYNSHVDATFANGCVKHVNTNMDSGTAMIRDVMKTIV